MFVFFPFVLFAGQALCNKLIIGKSKEETKEEVEAEDKEKEDKVLNDDLIQHNIAVTKMEIAKEEEIIQKQSIVVQQTDISLLNTQDADFTNIEEIPTTQLNFSGEKDNIGINVVDNQNTMINDNITGSIILMGSELLNQLSDFRPR